MNNEKKIVPQLRFPEFEEEWEIKTLSKCADVIDPHPSHRAPDTVSEGIPFIGIGDISEYGILDTKNIRIVSNEVYIEHFERYQLKVGDFAFGRVASVGKVVDLSNNIDEIYTYSPTMAIIQPQTINSTFLRFFCGSKFFKTQVNSKISGSTRKSIGMQNLRILKILFPKDPKEQQKIATCLSSLDDVIKAENEKLDLLKDHKKGLLQKLFPAEGKTQPEFRFPEFKDDGDWEETTIEELCKIHNNRRKPISSSKREKGVYPYYGASGIIDRVKDFIFDERLLLIGEDGAKWGSYEKTAFIVEGKYWVNNHAHVLEPIKINDRLLENFLVKMNIHPFITGAAPPKLTLNSLKKIPVPVPPSKEEQKKIAACLSSVDKLIEAQTQKIEQLQEHKKGLLQQLFPTINDLAI